MSSKELPVIEVAPGVTLTDDYRSGNIHGLPVDFGDRQAIVVGVMVEAYRKHGIKTWHNSKLMPLVRPDHHGRFVREEFQEKRDGKKGDHPAWGTFIRPARRRGFVELNLEP